MAFGLGQQSPRGLPVNFITVDESCFKRARVALVKPLEEIRTAQPVAAFSEQDNRSAVVAGKRSHVERFVSLNQVDVVREATATGDYDIALCGNRN